MFLFMKMRLISLVCLLVTTLFHATGVKLIERYSYRKICVTYIEFPEAFTADVPFTERDEPNQHRYEGMDK